MSDDDLSHLEQQFACTHNGPCEQTRLSMDMDGTTGEVVIVAHGDEKDLVAMSALMVASFMQELGVPRLIVARLLLGVKLPKGHPDVSQS